MLTNPASSRHFIETVFTTTKIATYLRLYATFFDRPIMNSMEKNSHPLSTIDRGCSLPNCFSKIYLGFS